MEQNIKRGILRAITVTSLIFAVLGAIGGADSPPAPGIGIIGSAFLGAVIGAAVIWVLAGIGWILYRMVLWVVKGFEYDNGKLK